MNKATFREYIKPFVVLVTICLAAAFLLAYTNGITRPIIDENARIAAEQTRSAVLPGAENFEEISCDTDALDIINAYRETSGKGCVVTSEYKGYGGLVTVTVGISPDGKIVGISADVGTETKGIGSRAGESSYTDRFIGISGSAASVDTLAQATYSSTAVKTCVSKALSAFDKLGEAAK